MFFNHLEVVKKALYYIFFTKFKVLATAASHTKTILTFRLFLNETIFSFGKFGQKYLSIFKGKMSLPA